VSTDQDAPYPPDAVGKRMAVRHRLSDGRLTDTVGILLERADGTALLRDRRGRRHRVGDGSVLAVTVPPTGAGLTPPHRRRAIDAPAAELLAAQTAGWVAAEQSALGDWTLRANGGYTSRANSALAVGDPGVSLPAALASVAEHYRQRGLPAGV
jgi:N-acetylglutamate synthase